MKSFDATLEAIAERHGYAKVQQVFRDGSAYVVGHCEQQSEEDLNAAPEGTFYWVLGDGEILTSTLNNEMGKS